MKRERKKPSKVAYFSELNDVRAPPSRKVVTYNLYRKQIQAQLKFRVCYKEKGRITVPTIFLQFSGCSLRYQMTVTALEDIYSDFIQWQEAGEARAIFTCQAPNYLRRNSFLSSAPSGDLQLQKIGQNSVTSSPIAAGTGVKARIYPGE